MDISILDVGTLVGALGVGALLKTFITLLADRRKLKVQNNIAEATQNSQIGIMNVQELETKLGYITKIVEFLEVRNKGLQEELQAAYVQNHELNLRVREQAEEIRKLHDQVRDLSYRLGDLEAELKNHKN